jgi:hypothetical protein
MQFPDLSGMTPRGNRSAQPLPILSGVSQTSTRALAQNLSLEFSEDGE